MRSNWQNINTCPKDGTVVLRPHKMWGAIAVRHKREDQTEDYLQGYSWMNFDYSVLWPEDAFLPYWMPRPSTEQFKEEIENTRPKIERFSL